MATLNILCSTLKIFSELLPLPNTYIPLSHCSWSLIETLKLKFGPNVEAEIFVWDVELESCLKFWPWSSLFIQFVDCYNVWRNSSHFVVAHKQCKQNMKWERLEGGGRRGSQLSAGTFPITSSRAIACIILSPSSWHHFHQTIPLNVALCCHDYKPIWSWMLWQDGTRRALIVHRLPLLLLLLLNQRCSPMKWMGNDRKHFLQK